MSEPSAERVAEIANRQERMGELLREHEADGLLVLDPANFSWLTAGGSFRGIPHSEEFPALYFSTQQHWLLCANVDTQRIFDEEIDGLAFQLKEWAWDRGRQLFLADLCVGKKMLCDQTLGECVNAGERLRTMRRTLTAWEQERLKELGKTVAHALEATCRNVSPGESEEEIAGQLGHRLIHRGVEPVDLQVFADSRARRYKRGGPTPAKIERTCVLLATGKRWGLHVTASRTVSFGPPDEKFYYDFEVSCRQAAMQIAGSVAFANPANILSAGIRVLTMNEREHEWRLTPPGWLTGHAPVELPFLPNTKDEIEPGWPLVWMASVGGANSADTILIGESSTQIITPTELWPLKRIRITGQPIERPDILIRTK
ncbi:MAG TPA: M24 family metallopeptidase [Gemmataceae bacterium]|nr:M24 family metallopeptidase [Gemmataceae bacterium]